MTTDRLPMILDEVEVVRVERLSPSFVRVELGGAALADFGVEGPCTTSASSWSSPTSSGRLPSFAGADESWFGTWLDIPEEERGHMRTYTVREVRGRASTPGSSSTWCCTSRRVDRARVALGGRRPAGRPAGGVAPRSGDPFGGIEFAPGTARHLLLAGDETAVPAVSAILGSACPRGRAGPPSSRSR